MSASRPSAPVEVRLSPQTRRNFAVIVPAYNEAENIPELFAELADTFTRYGLHGEVILVDDGSSDGTAEVARRETGRLPRAMVAQHAKNLGKTEALLTGAGLSESNYLVLFDADLQHLPEEIPRFLAALEAGYDIVTGRKIGAYDKQRVSQFYNWLSRRIFRVPVHDLNSMKAFRRLILDEIHLRHDWHRFFVVLAHARGFRVGEIDIPLHPRRHGQSKYTGSGRILVGLLDLVTVWFQLVFSRKPMLFFGFTGLALFVLGAGVGIAGVVLRVLGHGFRPILELVVLLVVTGISLFGFGFVSEMVASLRSQVDELQLELRRLRGGGGSLGGTESRAEGGGREGGEGDGGGLRPGGDLPIGG